HNTGATGAPCAPTPIRAPDGQLASLIALSDQERAGRSDGRQTALWPISGIAATGGDIVFYQKVLYRDYFDVTVVGTGAARLRSDGLADRLTPAKYPAEPTLTWLAPQADWGAGALVATDGLAYVYGCYQRAPFDLVCRVARVAPDQAGDPDAYRYFAGESAGWVDRVEQAAVVLKRTGRLSGV